MIRAITTFKFFTLVRYAINKESYRRNKLEYFFFIFKITKIYKNYFFQISSIFKLLLGCSIFIFTIRAITTFKIFTLVRHAIIKESYCRNKIEYFFFIFKIIKIYKNYFFQISSLFKLLLGCSIFIFMIRAITTFKILTLVRHAINKESYRR